MTDLQRALFELQDVEYKKFHQKLMPTVNEESVIGVRTPVLRKFAKEFSKRENADEFLKNLPHKYYEENNLHGFLLEQIKDYDVLIKELNKFLPFVDNWATCDMMKPKILKNHRDELIKDIDLFYIRNNYVPHIFNFCCIHEFKIFCHFILVYCLPTIVKFRIKVSIHILIFKPFTFSSIL